MRVLVTGGAGFLGSHLVDLLRAEGNDVVALDDLSTGTVENLAAHSGKAGFALLRRDARDREAVDEAVQRADAVFHLAGAVGVKTVAEDPAGTWSRNVEGTASVLAACARHGTRCLVASTSEVYGPAAAGTGAPIRHVPFADVYGEDFVDPPRRRPDTSRLADLTGFSPSRRLADAVADAVAFARSRRGDAVPRP